MTEQSEHEEQKQVKASPPFHKRWNIEVNSEEAKRNFVSRALNLIEVYLPGLQKSYGNRTETEDRILQLLATELGARYRADFRFSNYIDQDFIKLLHALEELVKVLGVFDEARQEILKLLVIEETISLSEADLGIQWRDGLFYKSGAKLLDETLVNENLRWLSDTRYADVLAPFEKGLGHFLEAHKQPGKLGDTITDMYEALEATAKAVTGKDRDLSGNKELFISKLRLSEYYKIMLENHIGYANQYRHAAKPGKRRRPPLPNEVEAFVYTTGLFIRLSIQQLEHTTES